jgi:hypothetical protein
MIGSETFQSLDGFVEGKIIREIECRSEQGVGGSYFSLGDRYAMQRRSRINAKSNSEIAIGKLLSCVRVRWGMRWVSRRRDALAP